MSKLFYCMNNVQTFHFLMSNENIIVFPKRSHTVSEQKPQYLYVFIYMKKSLFGKKCFKKYIVCQKKP